MVGVGFMFRSVLSFGVCFLNIQIIILSDISYSTQSFLMARFVSVTLLDFYFYVYFVFNSLSRFIYTYFCMLLFPRLSSIESRGENSTSGPTAQLLLYTKEGGRGGENTHSHTLKNKQSKISGTRGRERKEGCQTRP